MPTRLAKLEAYDRLFKPSFTSLGCHMTLQDGPKKCTFLRFKLPNEKPIINFFLEYKWTIKFSLSHGQQEINLKNYKLYFHIKF
jgi:hypothetical protein